MRNVVVLCGLIAIALAAACFNTPDYTDGALECSDEGTCPSGSTCVNDRCYHSPDFSITVFIDGGVADAAQRD